MTETLMKLNDIAEYFNIHYMTVYRLVREKKIPAFKIGNRWRSKRSLIDEWVEDKSSINK